MRPDTDPILIEVLRNEIETVGEEMHIAILKTARSPMLKMGDFATAIADRRGRVIGHNMSSGFFVSAFTSVMNDVLSRWGDNLHSGDVIVCNDPYRGASHKPDVYVVVPLFHERAHVGFALTYSHHADVGGRFAGGMSSHALNSFEEGLQLPTVKLFDAGVRILEERTGAPCLGVFPYADDLRLDAEDSLSLDIRPRSAAPPRASSISLCR